jgi:tetratricopeptide (TPR) repeat protein
MMTRYVTKVLLVLTLTVVSHPLSAQSTTTVRDSYATANGLLRAGDFAAAVSAYGEAIKANPNNAYAYYGRGLAYGATGKLDEAVADYTEAIRRDAKFAMAYQARAKVLLGKRELDKAIADCDTAIQLSQNSVEAYGCRARAFENKGDHSKAIADYARLIQLDPTNPEWHANRAFDYLKIANIDAALAECESAIKLDPENALAFMLRGAAYREKGDRAKADADTQKGQRLLAAKMIKDANVSIQKGNVLLEKGDYDKAISAYSEAIRICPAYHFGHYGRGLAYLAAGKLVLQR